MLLECVNNMDFYPKSYENICILCDFSITPSKVDLFNYLED